jgi:hypothetical protein
MIQFSRLLFFLTILFAIAHLSALRNMAQPAAKPAKKLSWFKGNTHTHTSNSDGDSSPADVVDWYKKNHYDFLVITDHEHITAIDDLNLRFAKDGDFLVIQGQEVTDRLNKKPYHVNGLGLGRVVQPQRGTDIVSNLQKNVDAVRDGGGIPQINHPNFGWAISADDLLQVKRVHLLEIYSGHPLVNMMGGGGFPSAEEIWDAVLTGGSIYYGVAVDDSHHFKRPGDRSAATPGHGWIVVRAEALSAAAILAALERGDFYASSGVELDDYSVSSAQVSIKIREQRSSKYRTQFIGDGGKVLSESITNPAVYRFTGKERYVRAKVFESNGKLAWTQPIFRKTR